MNAKVTTLPTAGNGTEELEMFCVISPTVDAQGTKRTWKKTQAEAVKHGQRLLSEQAARGVRGGGRRLFIVRVVEVVELPGPTVNRRKPELDDFEQIGGTDEA